MRPSFALALLLVPVLPPAMPSPVAAAPAAPPPLRIGLDRRFRHSTTLLLSCAKPFSLLDAATNKPLVRGLPGMIFKASVSPQGVALTRADDVTATPVARPVAALLLMPGQTAPVQVARMDGRPLTAHGIPWRHYRGFLTVRREPEGTLRVVNTVALEPYLYGVIPAEIGSDVPLEAMKAQAVAARTYALKNRGKLAREGFDLDDTTRCEGYLGVDGETPLSNASVDDTRGLVLAYAGTLIDAPYSTDSGGVTADGGCAYLRPVKDCNEADGKDYAANGKYHTWSRTFTPAQLASALARDPRTRVTRFASLALDGLDASGRVTTATVAGTDGTLKTVTGPSLRQILGYDVLRSTRLTLTRTATGDYKFDGKGWGHGLGMSQDGAVSMAGPPYRKTYGEILRHYYVGTALVSDLAVALPRAH